jgi:Calcineurin-like phosphoesterase
MACIEFQLLSDLHLETPYARPIYHEFEVLPKAPYLALLGDIGHVKDSRLFNFLERQLEVFELVFFVFGNHEAYGMTLPGAKATMETFILVVETLRATKPDIGKFILLDQGRFDISESFTILGCTLFSKILPEQEGSVRLFVSDFSEIYNWTTDDHNSAHDSDVRWLNSQIEHLARNEPQRHIIIFTHYCPTLLAASSDPQHLNDPAEVRSGFSTDLTSEPCWISPQVKVWAFGHTHFNCDFLDTVSRKRLVTNQKGGKRNEALGFDVQKVISIRRHPYPIRDERRAEEDPPQITTPDTGSNSNIIQTNQSFWKHFENKKRSDNKCLIQ